MKKLILAAIAGFMATFIVNTILAIAIIGPLFSDKLGIVRKREVGLNFPPMLGGYLVLTIFIVWLVTLQNKTWLQKGFIAGGASGLAVFVAGHSIVAGWSVADAGAMAFSGFIDTFAIAE